VPALLSAPTGRSPTLHAITELDGLARPGLDGAGTVTAIGDDVTRFRVGDRVVGQFWSQPRQFGTFAEVCVVQAPQADTPVVGQ
jgi:threonine dehydrogenase-like Zn-dependent dehydrogenase